MHSRVSGLSDYFAVDELDCIRIGREIVRRPQLAQARAGAAPRRPTSRSTTPRSCSASRPPTCGCRSTRARCIARIVDGSRFDEYKPLYGTSLVTGWASLHGYPVGDPRQRTRRAVQRGGQEGHRVHPARQPDRHAAGVPAEHHRLHGRARTTSSAGSIKDGAKMINAVANSRRPAPHRHHRRRRYGAGNYGMCGRGLRAAVHVRLAEREARGDGPRSSSPA